MFRYAGAIYLRLIIEEKWNHWFLRYGTNNLSSLFCQNYGMIMLGEKNNRNHHRNCNGFHYKYLYKLWPSTVVCFGTYSMRISEFNKPPKAIITRTNRHITVSIKTSTNPIVTRKTITMVSIVLLLLFSAGDIIPPLTNPKTTGRPTQYFSTGPSLGILGPVHWICYGAPQNDDCWGPTNLWALCSLSRFTPPLATPLFLNTL